MSLIAAQLALVTTQLISYEDASLIHCDAALGLLRNGFLLQLAEDSSAKDCANALERSVGASLPW
jgi:hypothetical protein